MIYKDPRFPSPTAHPTLFDGGKGRNLYWGHSSPQGPPLQPLLSPALSLCLHLALPQRRQTTPWILAHKGLCQEWTGCAVPLLLLSSPAPQGKQERFRGLVPGHRQGAKKLGMGTHLLRT